MYGRVAPHWVLRATGAPAARGLTPGPISHYRCLNTNQMSEMSENMSYFAAVAAALEMLEEFVFRQKVLSTNAALVLPFLLSASHFTREVCPKF